MVLFTSFAVERQRRVRLRWGITPDWMDAASATRSNKDQRRKPRRAAWPGRVVATEPQWPRMKSPIVRSLRIRHSRVIPKIGRHALRFGRFRPSSLPRFAASDDGRFAPSEPPARPCRPVMPLASMPSCTSDDAHHLRQRRMMLLTMRS